MAGPLKLAAIVTTRSGPKKPSARFAAAPRTSRKPVGKATQRAIQEQLLENDTELIFHETQLT